MSTLLAIAADDEEQPTSFAVAPLEDGWTVVSPEADAFIAPKQPWSLVDAGAARLGLALGFSHPQQYDWVSC